MLSLAPSAWPQATFHVLKAVLHVLGKEPDTFKNWKRVYSYFSENLFREMHEFEATQVSDARSNQPTCLRKCHVI
jgi:hypothetical protein